MESLAGTMFEAKKIDVVVYPQPLVYPKAGQRLAKAYVLARLGLRWRYMATVSIDFNKINPKGV